MNEKFDALKAVGEELAGLHSVDAAFRRRIDYAEARLGEAESELLSLRQIYGYLKIEIERKRAVQAELLRKKEMEEKTK